MSVSTYFPGYAYPHGSTPVSSQSANPLFRAVTVVPREPIGGDGGNFSTSMRRLPSYLLHGATFPNPYNSYRGRLFIRALQPPSAARVSEYALENPPER